MYINFTKRENEREGLSKRDLDAKVATVAALLVNDFSKCYKHSQRIKMCGQLLQ
jgi:hypothetical protein